MGWLSQIRSYFRSPSRQMADPALHAEVDALKGRLETTEMGLKRVMDGQFDADTYRQAIEVAYKDYVYGKLWTTLGTILAALSLGFSGLALAVITTQVDRKISERVGEFEELRTMVEASYVLSLISQYNQTGDSTMLRVLLDADRREAIASLITRPPDELAFANVATFAAAQRDRAGDIYSAVGTVARDKSMPASVRVPALTALVRAEPRDIISTLARAIDEAEGLDDRAAYARALAAQRPQSTRHLAPALPAMRRALASEDRRLYVAALRFFALNSDQCDAECVTQASGNPNFQKGDSPLITLANRDNDAASSTHSVGDRAKEVRAALDTILATARRQNLSDVLPLYRHTSIWLLARGDPAAYELSRRDPGPPLAGSAYPYDLWQRSVAPIFPDFVREQQQRLGVESLSELTLPNERELAQVALLDAIDRYEWDEALGVYVSIESQSIRDLVRGDLDRYLDWMSTGYYAEEAWLNEILPRFPGFLVARGVDAELAEASEQAQDDLWHWVRNNRRFGLLRFENNEYVCANPCYDPEDSASELSVAEPEDLFSELPVEGPLEQDVDGELTPSDIHNGGLFQAWDLSARAGEHFTVRLESSDFDSYLYVVGAGLGTLSNDDSDGGLDSRLSFTAPEDGVIRVVVSSYDGAPGEYRLSVARGR